MASLPAQLNFYDLALVLSPPIVLTALSMPFLERAFGCWSSIQDPKSYEWLEGIPGAAVAVGLLAVFVLLYWIGQLLLAIMDFWRYKLTRKVYKIKFVKHQLKKTDPFTDRYESHKSKEEYEKRLLSLGVVLGSARSNIWAGAGFVQQRGQYASADRFNTLAIYSFCMSTLAVIALALNSAWLAIFGFDWYLLAWSVGLLSFAIIWYWRAMFFHKAFTANVMGSVIAVPSSEFGI
ncbi:MAG: hypothetical protein ACI89L_001905 [Phycisphaerales bacterium]|jgi:hypothetical protein